MDPTWGVILAGGRSRRLGQDKATVAIPGGTPLGRTIQAVRAAGLQPLIIGRTTAPDFPEVPCQADDHEDGGPAAGILTALRRAEGKAVVVVPCDLPGLSAAFLTWLISAWQEAGRPAALAAHSGESLQPIPGIYTPAVQTMLMPGRGLYPLFARAELVTVALPSIFAAVLDDLDTPEDLARHRGESRQP